MDIGGDGETISPFNTNPDGTYVDQREKYNIKYKAIFALGSITYTKDNATINDMLGDGILDTLMDA